MKFIFAFLAFALTFAAFAYAQPLLSESESLWEPAGEVTQEHIERFKRASCDIFSFESKWLTPNDSVCAAHCLVKGYKGGSCKNRICHCRDKF